MHVRGQNVRNGIRKCLKGWENEKGGDFARFQPIPREELNLRVKLIQGRSRDLWMMYNPIQQTKARSVQVAGRAASKSLVGCD